jgi:hypothetical protein
MSFSKIILLFNIQENQNIQEIVAPFFSAALQAIKYRIYIVFRSITFIIDYVTTKGLG